MYSARDDIRLRMPGCPIRKSPDQSLLGGSPKLIAAAHVLHRLLAPRHPPCALSLLIVKNTLVLLWSFQGARELSSPSMRSTGSRAGLSKLNSVHTSNPVPE